MIVNVSPTVFLQPARRMPHDRMVRRLRQLWLGERGLMKFDQVWRASLKGENVGTLATSRDNEVTLLRRASKWSFTWRTGHLVAWARTHDASRPCSEQRIRPTTRVGSLTENPLRTPSVRRQGSREPRSATGDWHGNVGHLGAAQMSTLIETCGQKRSGTTRVSLEQVTLYVDADLQL